MLLPIASASAGFFEQFAPPNRDLNAQGAGKNGSVADGYDGRDRTALKEIMTTVTTTDQSAAPKTGDPIADILDRGNDKRWQAKPVMKLPSRAG